ncbi:MAG: Hsp70 family protein [Candidatus Velthaea sp.]
MTRARFSVGIDLGTTNCALACVALDRDAGSDVVPIPQRESSHVVVEAATLPSFLYLPDDEEAGAFAGAPTDGERWVIGRLARTRSAERPERVAHSAKSWLCHHAVDRSAPILPWGSGDIARENKLSPVGASALILQHLRAAWNERFAPAGADFAFDNQIVTITVPASFDAVAQRLTLAAAAEAGFPETVRLLEEPQAAFYRWLEHAGAARAHFDQPGHVLVVDIGGGTSDFSLFAFDAPGADGSSPRITRIAVSDHILLGGDNMDLALAHRLEPQFVDAGERLSGGQFAALVARCRDAKESALSHAGPPGQTFPIVLAGRGSSLIAGARSAQLTRAEIEAAIIDGFFPDCYADERPLQKKAALGEWGLPYAADPAVTRHLAAFLRDRPAVDAVLFNGGALAPLVLRERLCRQIGSWQNRPPPPMLDNLELDLAVARGAACFGALGRGGERIAAGSARAIFLEAHRASLSGEAAEGPPLVCILPRNAPTERRYEIADLALELRINRPVQFRTYYSTRHGANEAGDVVAWNDRDFQALPPLETVARAAGADHAAESQAVPVRLNAKLNELGLLELACRSTDPQIRGNWPLEFNLRPSEAGAGGEPGRSQPSATPAESGPNAAPAALDAARGRIAAMFGQPLNRRDKLTASRLIKSLELLLGMPKSEWNVLLVRALWSTLDACMTSRRTSLEHEEAWLILAGFLLRPGFGAALDEARIDRLWTLRETGLAFRSKALEIQEHILWRRVGGGLSRERQESIVAPHLDALCRQPNPSPELVLLAGSLERIGPEMKTGLVEGFIDAASAHAAGNKHYAHYLAALALLLNRTPLYAGPETVVAPELVARAFEAFARLEWDGPKLKELQTLFLRAARLINNRSLDVPKSVRNRIADRLERSGVPPAKTIPLREYVPMERAERISLFGESLPHGLILREQ